MNIAQFYPPRKERFHEVCGPGAYVFVCALGALFDGRIMWIRENWRQDMINPTGASVFFDPDNLLMALVKDKTEVLAVAEEALRSGAVPLVVLEVDTALDLTAGRRLHLAAREGKSTGLAIIPEGMGSNTAETRWRCMPVFDRQDSTLQKWELIKNKSGTLSVWHVRWDTATRRFIMVSPAGE